MVLFVSYAGVDGGAERLLVDWAAGLDRAVAIACPSGPLAQKARAAGLRVLALQERDLRLRARPATSALRDLAGHAREIRALVQALDPELVVAWGPRPLLATATLRRPLAFQANEFVPGAALGTLVRRAAARADLVTAPSQAVIDALALPRTRRPRTHVVAPGVDLDRIAATDGPIHPPEILLLGAIVSWKRPELALEILNLVRRTIPAARLRVAGAPLPGDAAGAELLTRLRGHAQAPDLAGAVEFAGPIDDAAHALSQCSLLLHCADREPFGIAVAEALAAGRPAVVPDRAGPAEIVDDRCGRRYRPGDAAAAAQAVTDILTDAELARQMGHEGRRRAETHFERGRQRAAYRAAVGPLLGQPTRFRAQLAHELALVTVTHS